MEKKTVMIPFVIDQDFVDGVCCTAFEGGINYWATCAKAKGEAPKGASYASEVISRGGEVIITLDEPHDEDDTWDYTLTLDNFIEGYNKYVQWAVELNRTFYTDPADIDATEADVIIQMAIFGEIIYG